MRPLPDSEQALVLRTDFSDPDTWHSIRDAVSTPVGVLGFQAQVRFVDDPDYEGVTREQIPGLFRPGSEPAFIVVADRFAMTHPERALLVIDLFEESPIQEFRAVPSAIQSIENNLSIGNMDFEEFAGGADADGIFRAFA